MKLLIVALALPLTSCFGERVCRVEYAGQVILDIGGEPIPLQAPYEVWDVYARQAPTLGSDCLDPDCHVVGDSLFYLQQVRGFDRVLSEEGRSLSGCDVIVTRACAYDVDMSAETIQARSECGPDFNAEYFRE